MTTERMKPSEALRKARELITPEGAWTQGVMARNKAGKGTSPLKGGAVCWCSFGAMESAIGHTNTEYVELFLEKAIGIENSDEEDIASWNDAHKRNQSEVIGAFDRAASLAESEGQ